MPPKPEPSIPLLAPRLETRHVDDFAAEVVSADDSIVATAARSSAAGIYNPNRPLSIERVSRTDLGAPVPEPEALMKVRPNSPPVAPILMKLTSTILDSSSCATARRSCGWCPE